MGMDIYGLNPQIVGKQPTIDFEKATDEEKEQFFKDLNAWEESNPGYYFRANLWSWRPIHALIESVLIIKELDWDTSLFGENSGGGFKTQEECDIIADGIQDLIDEMIDEEKETIYLNLGMWVSWDGKFNVPEEIQEELTKQNTKLFVQSPIVASNGELVIPAHSTNINHIKEFVNFLRHCGGFEIW